MKVQDLANAKVMPFVEYKGDIYYLLEEEERQADGTWKVRGVRANDALNMENDTTAWAPIYNIYFTRKFDPDEYDIPDDYAEVICVDGTEREQRFEI